MHVLVAFYCVFVQTLCSPFRVCVCGDHYDAFKVGLVNGLKIKTNIWMTSSLPEEQQVFAAWECKMVSFVLVFAYGCEELQ